MADDVCKLCGEPLPKLSLHSLNKVAIERGFCSWICLSMSVGHAKVRALIKKDKEERRKRKE